MSKFNVYFWVGVKTSEFTEVTMIDHVNGEIDLDGPTLFQFLQNHSDYYIAFNIKQKMIYIDTKLFKQR